jgi:hypothetical protein
MQQYGISNHLNENVNDLPAQEYRLQMQNVNVNDETSIQMQVEQQQH